MVKLGQKGPAEQWRTELEKGNEYIKKPSLKGTKREEAGRVHLCQVQSAGIINRRESSSAKNKVILH